MNSRIAIILLLILLPQWAPAETVFMVAERDVTLIEDPDGAKANGSGPSIFVGRTGQPRNGIRRGLLYFDVAAALPKGVIIESASLTLYLAPSNDEPREIRLHRLLAGWGEGPSSASGGKGAPSEPGDATWLHTFYKSEFWVRSGGQFLGRVSAHLMVGASGFFTWDSNIHLVQDVRLWNKDPNRNFGWLLLGDETAIRTAKNFASRENPISASRPMLRITYRLPERP